MGHAYLQNWTGQCLSLFHPWWLSHYDALNKTTRRDAKLMVSVADTKTCSDICPKYYFQWQFIFVNYYTLSGIPCLSMNTRICVILYCSYCILNIYYTPVQLSSLQLLSCVWLFATPWTTARQHFPVHHQLPEFTQTHLCWVRDAIQPSSPSPPAFNLSQHQG